VKSGKCEGCPFITAHIESNEIYKRDIMIIGDSPGRNEIAKGQPFVREAGTLLWKTLAAFGIKREDCAITNALRCYVPDEIFQKKAKVLVDPIHSCRHRLVDEIRIVQPKVIIALGNVALQALTLDFDMKIGNQRGIVHDVTIYDENGEVEFVTKVITSYPPSTILKKPNEYRKFRRDLAYAKHLALGGQPKDPGESKWMAVEEPFSNAHWRALDMLLGAGYDDLPKDEDGCLLVGADIETNSLDPISGGVLALGLSPKKNFTIIFSDKVIPYLGELFDSDKIKFIWHNGKFDTKFLQRIKQQKIRGQGPKEDSSTPVKLPARLDHDTILLHYCLDEQKGTHDLKQLSTYNLGAGDYSGEFKEYMPEKNATFADAPKEALYSYLAKDCDYTRQLFELFYPQVTKDKKLNFLYHKLLIPLSHLLLKVEERGVWVDPQYLDDLEQKLNKQLEEYEEAIQKAVEPYWDELEYAFDTKVAKVPDTFNPGSPKQLKWLLYSAMNMRPGKGRKKDTNEETLKTLPHNPVTDGILQYRKVKKQIGTYVTGMRKHIRNDGRVHTTFMIFGTETGRLSSADPNTQNIPRDKIIKDIFAAPPGRLLLDLDLSQAELRTLAALSGDKALTEVYKEGRDLHDETAEAIYGPNYTSENRTASKSVNFGICYGLTEYSLVQSGSAKNEREARKMIQGWKNAFPVAWQYLQDQRELPVLGKYAESPFGRRRRFPLITPETLNAIQNEASNHAIQGVASDLNLLVCMNIDDALVNKFDTLLVNIVHDSIIMETPDDLETIIKIEKFAQETLTRVAKEWLKTDVPFLLDGKFGKAWGSAQPITDELRTKYLN
jgi:uracil-DNA glycosylase family 4